MQFPHVRPALFRKAATLSAKRRRGAKRFALLRAIHILPRNAQLPPLIAPWKSPDAFPFVRASVLPRKRVRSIRRRPILRHLNHSIARALPRHINLAVPRAVRRLPRMAALASKKRKRARGDHRRHQKRGFHNRFLSSKKIEPRSNYTLRIGKVSQKDREK